MKPKFGDLQSKSDFIEMEKHKQRFERQVTNAVRLLAYCPTLPARHSQKWDYPELVRAYSLDVLEEAVRREQQRRAL